MQLVMKLALFGWLLAAATMHPRLVIIFPPIGLLPPVSIATAIIKNLSISCLTTAETNWPPLASCPRSLPLVLRKCCGMVF